MPLDLTFIVRRIEWLEADRRRLLARLADLEDRLSALSIDQAEETTNLPNQDLIIVRPTGTIGMASFTEAVPGTSLAKIVPATGTCRLWQTFDRTTGELRALETVPRWDPDPEPGEFVDTPVTVTVDNINDQENIPSTAKYIICGRKAGRLIAALWHCGD